MTKELKNVHMKKKEAIIIPILTLLIAFMDITGIPTSLLMNLQIADIEPMYFTLMVNFVLIGIVAYLTLRFVCSEWKVGLQRKGLLSGLKRFGMQGVIYYIGVAIVEELHCTNETKAQWEKALQNSLYTLMAYIDEKPIAMGRLSEIIRDFAV